MSKKRRGDRLQRIYGFSDVAYEEKDGTITIIEAKHHGNSPEHIIPSMLPIRRLRSLQGMPDIANQPDLPEWGEKLLPFLLPRKLRDAVTGDLTEDFRTYAARWGRPYALRWLWWELACLAVRRFGPAGVITAVAMWFRQKLGL